jgi:hypothetical protein
MMDHMIGAVRQAARRFYAQYDPAATAAYVRANCRSEAEHLLHQAEDLMQNTFVFTDRWDMEPCAVPYTMPAGQWTHSPNGDPEWVFMLNRHDYLPKLWQAAVLTGEVRYRRKLIDSVMDWIASNPLTREGTPSTRTIDTGIRCMNWIQLLPFLLAEDALTDQEARTMIDSLSAQFANLRERYILKYTLSNWGVLQTTAFCAGYAWMGQLLPPGLEAWAWQELQTQLRLQILEDGAHWEQSPMYHVEVLNACVRLLTQLYAAQKAGLSLCQEARFALDAGTSSPERKAGPGEGAGSEAGWLVRAVRVLSRHVLYTADPSLMQLPQCDSDVTDVRDVLARAAALLSDAGIYRWGAGETLDMDSVWQLGAAGIAAFEAQRPQTPVRCSWNCPQSGTVTLRSDWTARANFTALKNSPLGSSHGHADQTHLTLYCQGKPFLVDSGRYTYREDDPLRTQLKAPAAHNVCVIDGQSGGTPDGSWNYSDYAEIIPHYFAEQGNAHFVEMTFHGCLRDGTPYQITRRLFVLDEGVWLSVQDVICPGKHQVKEYFHLAQGVTVQPCLEGMLLQNGDAQLKMYYEGQMECHQGVLSSCYNQKELAPLLVHQVEMQDRWTSCTLFAVPEYAVRPAAVYKLGEDTPQPAENVTALDLQAGQEKCWTLLVWNRENFRSGKVFRCHGQPVYGKAIALCDQDGRVKSIRLR